MCKRCPFTSSATDSFIIIIYASGLLNYGCCFGVLLTPGKLLITPNHAYIGPNKIDLSSDAVYVHPSAKQCNYSYTHPSEKQCNYTVSLSTISGVLPVDKGGTGVTTLDDLKDLLGLSGMISSGVNLNSLALGDTFNYISYRWMVCHRTSTALYAITDEIISLSRFGYNTSYISSDVRDDCREMAGFIPSADANKILVDSSTHDDMIFIPSYNQMNGGFAYFDSDEDRIAYYNGEAEEYWTSTTSTSSTSSRVYLVGHAGDLISSEPKYEYGVRPCIAFKI